MAVDTFADGYQVTLASAAASGATAITPSSTVGAPVADPTLIPAKQFRVVLQSANYPQSGTRDVVTVTDSRTTPWVCSPLPRSYAASDIIAGSVAAAALGSLLTQPVIGTLAGMPTAPAFGKGIYYASDDSGGTPYYSDGTSWTKLAAGVGQGASGLLVAGPAKITANFQTTSTVDVDIPGLSVTFTALGGVSYEIWLKANVGNTVSGALGYLSLCDASNAVLDTVGYTARAVNDSAPILLVATVTPAAGSVTYKARLRGSASTGFVLAAPTYPAQLKARRES